jgi:hypothetical protein
VLALYQNCFDSNRLTRKEHLRLLWDHGKINGAARVVVN